MTRPAIPTLPLLGGCLCGAVRYKLEAPPRAVNACHCMDCKRLTGATHLLMLLADRDAFIHERGETHRYRKRADSGREVDILRCARCGVRMWHEPLVGTEWVFVAAGTLDDPTWAVPTSHIWTKRVSSGVELHADAFQCEAQPENRQVLVDAFLRHYGP